MPLSQRDSTLVQYNFSYIDFSFLKKSKFMENYLKFYEIISYVEIQNFANLFKKN